MDTWVAIDFETANEHRGSPCAVGMVAVEDDQPVQAYTSYIQPPPPVAYFSPFCVSIHGITPDKVVGAPCWAEALEGIVRFADGRPLVAHNAAFDLGVIRDACTETGLPWPELRYACTLVVARRTWPLLSYSLPWVTEAAGVQLSDHHDPGADAVAAAQVLVAATRAHQATDLSSLLAQLRIGFGQVSPGSWQGCHHTGASRTRTAIPGANPDADPDGPFYGRSVCFTGALLSMTREQAWHRVAEVGGRSVPGVTKATQVLVVGTQDGRRLRPGTSQSGKQRKAAQLLAAGQEIEMISEADFLERLAATEGVARSARRPYGTMYGSPAHGRRR
ncbi:MAG TPA: exonuclease domain-containing protein [Actinomycetes bacterium]|nr:exonuclease domain-containing protein [Actinomycetes bacterium]